MSIFDKLTQTMTSLSLSLAAVALLSATSSHAALIVPEGNNLVVNHTAFDIAWTQDANLFKTQANSYAGGPATFVNAVIASVPGGRVNDMANSADTPAYSGYRTLAASDFNTITGQMNWWGAQAWTTYLNSINYAGVTGWRLPDISPVNGSSFNFPVSFDGSTDRGFNGTLVNSTASEFANLFYNELGNLAAFDSTGAAQPGAGLTNSGPFSNFQNDTYRLGPEYGALDPADPAFAWAFNPFNGGQGAGPKIGQYYGLAVREGQVAPVPIPGAVWLMGSALVGLVGLVRRRAAS